MSTLKVDTITKADGTNSISQDAIITTSSPQLGRRNLVINGAMQVAQRGTSATVSDASNEGYSTLDRWWIQFNSDIGGSITYSKSSDSPSGFASSAKIQCASTHTPAALNDYLSLRTTIEAQDLQQLGYGTSDAKEMTLSWYMKAETYSGPISIGFQTKDGTNEYFVKSVTPTSSWARYSITVPASTTATIDNDNGAGLQIEFVLSGDTANTSFDRATDSTAWETTRYQYVSDVGNILSNTSNAFYLTGVQLEVGSVATPFEHRSYGEELALCQRYFYRVYGETSTKTYWETGYKYTNGNVMASVQHPVPMRAKATYSGSSSAAVDVLAPSGTAYTSQGISASSLVSTYSHHLFITVTGLSVGDPGSVMILYGEYLDFDAEL